MQAQQHKGKIRRHRGSRYEFYLENRVQGGITRHMLGSGIATHYTIVLLSDFAGPDDGTIRL